MSFRHAQRQPEVQYNSRWTDRTEAIAGGQRALPQGIASLIVEDAFVYELPDGCASRIKIAKVPMPGATTWTRQWLGHCWTAQRTRESQRCVAMFPAVLPAMLKIQPPRVLTPTAFGRQHGARYFYAPGSAHATPMSAQHVHHCARKQMLKWRLVGLFLACCSTTANAASIAMSVTTTVLAVHCTAEQRTRIRACATPEQLTSIGSYKTMVTIESRRGQSDVVTPRQEILIDPSRQVMVKTLLY
jgi:hypothetical protein